MSSASVWAADKVSFAIATRPAQASFQLFDVQGKLLFEGKTPYVGQISPGIYRLRLSSSGYYEESRSLRVKPAKPVILQIDMISQKPQPRVRKRPKPPLPRTVRGSTAPPLRVGASSQPVRRGVPVPRKGSLAGASSQPAAKREPSGGPVQPPQGGPDPSTQGAPNRPPSGAVPPPLPARRQRPTSQKTAATQKAKPKTKAKPGPKVPWIPLAIAAACGIAGGVFFGLSEASIGASKDRNRTQIDAYNEHLNAQSHRTTGVSLLIAGGAAVAIAGLMYMGVLKPRNRATRGPKADRYSPITRVQAKRPLQPRIQRLLSADSVGGVH